VFSKKVIELKSHLKCIIVKPHKREMHWYFDDKHVSNWQLLKLLKMITHWLSVAYSTDSNKFKMAAANSQQLALALLTPLTWSMWISHTVGARRSTRRHSHVGAMLLRDLN